MDLVPQNGTNFVNHLQTGRQRSTIDDNPSPIYAASGPWKPGKHQHKPSLSAWSTSDSNEDSRSYSTPTSSIYHTPVSPAAKTFVQNIRELTNDQSEHSGYSADEEEDNADDDEDNNDALLPNHLDEHRAEYYQQKHKESISHVIQSSPIDADMGPEEWYARLESDISLADHYLGDECPDLATLVTVHDIPIYDCEGQTHTFGSLYDASTAVNQRQLIIFIRHFYCGACQAYIKALSERITLQDYFSIPIPTSIIVIGCGQPSLIPFYKAITGTKFPIFAEPSRQLYKKLGMVLSANLGLHRPGYMRDISTPAWLAGQLTTIRDGLRARNEARRLSNMTPTSFELLRRNTLLKPLASHASTIKGHGLLDQANPAINDHGDRKFEEQEEESDLMHHNLSLHARSRSLRRRDVVRGGNLFQVGGEFLFEDGQVIWCHRMRHYRNHIEISDLRQLLGLDS